MPYNFFPMIARMRYINRWGLMRNTRLENIQEHSHQVAVLAHALAVIENRYFGPRRCGGGGFVPRRQRNPYRRYAYPH